MTKSREWALVAFTLLMQLSIGAFLIVVAVSIGGGSPRHTFDGPLAAAACAGALALVCSLLHLGHPTQAWLALTNVRTSWLSREVLASALFVACAGVAVLDRRAGGGASAASAIAAVVGVIVIYAMSRVYMVPAQPSWNRLLTPVAFFTSTLLLGAAFLITTPALDPALTWRLASLAIGLAIVQMLLTPAYIAGLPGEPAAAVAIAPAGPVAILLTAMRITAALVAVVLLVAASGAPAQARLGAFVLVLVSELAGRVLFYAGIASLRPS